jgi:alpha-1,6-mannosyltransferase
VNKPVDFAIAETVSGAPATENSVALLRLWLLGGLVTAITLATPFIFRAGGDNAYMACAVATGLVAIAATSTAERAPTRNALWIIIGVAVFLRVVLLFTEPLLSSDIYRYVWDGKVQAAGINPYRYVPADETLATLRDSTIFPNINRVDYAVTIYPPVAQIFFFLVTRLGESVTVMKLALLACEAVTAVTIVLLLRKLGRPLTRLVAYVWHPLPIWEIANSGHIDALMVALMMLGIWLAVIGRPLRGGVMIALAALAKPFAVVTLPAIWRAWDWKLPLVVVGVVALCYAPYLSVGAGVLGFLTGGYFQEEQLAIGGNFWLLAMWRVVFGMLAGDTIIYLAGSGVVIVAMAMVAARRESRTAETVLSDICQLLLLFLFLLSPNYPWYFLAATPFVALVGGAPVWAMTVGAVLLQEEAAWDPHVPIMIRKSLHFGAFLLACAYVTWRSYTKRERLDAR